MDIQLDEETEKELREAAAAEGKDPGQLLRELARRYLEERNGEKKKSWLDTVSGSLAGYPEFDEVVEAGKKFRESVE